MGLVIGLILLLIMLAVLIQRRRTREKRKKLQNFFGRANLNQVGGTGIAASTYGSTEAVRRGVAGPVRVSVRSSWGNFGRLSMRSVTPREESDPDVPPSSIGHPTTASSMVGPVGHRPDDDVWMAPRMSTGSAFVEHLSADFTPVPGPTMAQVRSSTISASTVSGPMLSRGYKAAVVEGIPFNATRDRNSAYSSETSMSSATQRDSAGMLTIPPLIAVPEDPVSPSTVRGRNSVGSLNDTRPEQPRTPMSVRPFSPTESFAFPKPPDSSDANAGYNPFADPVTTPNYPSTIPGSGVSLLTPVPYSANTSSSILNRSLSTHSGTSSNVSDPQVRRSAAISTTPSAYETATEASVHESTESDLVDDKDEDSPFSDEAASGESGYYSTRSIAPGEKMTIYRQFVPTLSDELAVEVGEVVAVVQAYDDGWAKVRKDGQETVGLIPLDCFRAKGEDMPAFLASKRISSIYLGVAV